MLQCFLESSPGEEFNYDMVVFKAKNFQFSNYQAPLQPLHQHLLTNFYAMFVFLLLMTDIIELYSVHRKGHNVNIMKLPIHIRLHTISLNEEAECWLFKTS